MRKMAYISVCLGTVMASQPSFAADQGYYTGPQPTTTYTVCQEPAHFAFNNRARLIRRGQRELNVGENVAVLGRTPDLYFRNDRLVQNAYTYLSTGGC